MPAILSLKTLGPYFDVSDQLIRTRIVFALLPFNKKFFDNYKTKPDLYGPFWILTTLVATMFISSNLYCYITYPGDAKKALSISFKTIPVAATVVFTVGIGLPLLLKAILNLYGTGP